MRIYPVLDLMFLESVGSGTRKINRHPGSVSYVLDSTCTVPREPKGSRIKSVNYQTDIDVLMKVLVLNYKNNNQFKLV